MTKSPITRELKGVGEVTRAPEHAALRVFPTPKDTKHTPVLQGSTPHRENGNSCPMGACGRHNKDFSKLISLKVMQADDG